MTHEVLQGYVLDLQSIKEDSALLMVLTSKGGVRIFGDAFFKKYSQHICCIQEMLFEFHITFLDDSYGVLNKIIPVKIYEIRSDFLPYLFCMAAFLVQLAKDQEHTRSLMRLYQRFLEIACGSCFESLLFSLSLIQLYILQHHGLGDVKELLTRMNRTTHFPEGLFLRFLEKKLHPIDVFTLNQGMEQIIRQDLSFKGSTNLLTQILSLECPTDTFHYQASYKRKV